MAGRGWSPEARARAALARKIKSRFGIRAYEAFKQNGTIPSGLESDPSAKVLKKGAKEAGVPVQLVIKGLDSSTSTKSIQGLVSAPRFPGR